MKKIQIGKVVEIGVEGNNAAVSETCEGGEAAVSPEMMWKIRSAGQTHKPGINFRGIFDESNVGLDPVALIDIPRFIRAEWAA